MLVVLLFFSTVTTTASASRQIWAFSRDQVRQECMIELRIALISTGLPVLQLDSIRGSSNGGPCERRLMRSDCVGSDVSVRTSIGPGLC